jgi:hypothetical protein
MAMMHIKREESGVSLRITVNSGDALGTWQGLSEARVESMMRGCDISEADIRKAIEALRHDGWADIELP